jgi:hypothetical protein
MSAILAASHPLPPDARGPFLEACARELAALPEIGDGVVHRVVMACQRKFFDPPADTRAAWSIEGARRSRLKDGAPIDEDRDRRFTRRAPAKIS